MLTFLLAKGMGAAVVLRVRMYMLKRKLHTYTRTCMNKACFFNVAKSTYVRVGSVAYTLMQD